MNRVVDSHTQVSRHLRRLLCVLFAFVAVQMQMWSEKTTYQGVALTKPVWNEVTQRYIIRDRSELLWWAVNDQNKDIKLYDDINVQGEGKHLLAADGRTLAMKESEIVVWPCLYYQFSRVTIMGNNHTISGIYQNRGYGVDGARGSYKKYDYVGFISYSSTKADISDLTIADSYICGKYAGGFIGYKMPDGINLRTTEFKNCSFRGFVKGDWYAGGLVGWHRTDGEDLNVYRCFNYGTIEAGGPDISDYKPSLDSQGRFSFAIASMAAGGLVGYLDIKHTAVVQIHTSFSRCVNYGSVSCLTYSASAGGIVGRVWDNNNGKRVWDFCYNFGDVTGVGIEQHTSGIVGCYWVNNDCVKPKFRWCGAGSLIQGIKTTDGGLEAVTYYLGNKMYTSETAIKERVNSINRWSTDVKQNLTPVIMGGLSATGADYSNPGLVSDAADNLKKNEPFDLYGLPHHCFQFPVAIGDCPELSTLLSTFSLPSTGMGELYNGIRQKSNAPELMQGIPLIYTEKDIRNGRFAYDVNLALQADVLDGEKNTDKSPLFVQRVDLVDSTLCDPVPSIAYEGQDEDKQLHFGYYHCWQNPVVNNETTLLAEPTEHVYDSNGECIYCHTSMEPLGEVLDESGFVAYYTIKNQSQLRYFAAAINDNYDGRRSEYINRNIKLLNDIEVSPNVTWVPINLPYYDCGRWNWFGFYGTFDGQGHTISGLHTSDKEKYAGLFAYTTSRNAMHIKNLKLSNCVFKGRYAGSIIGMIAGDKTDDGGLFGRKRPITFDRIAVDNTVEVIPTNTGSDAAAGGFVGCLSRTNASNYDIAFSNCYSNARITCTRQQAGRVGNFVGYFKNRAGDDFEEGSTKPLFDHCYFGGTATCELNPMGTAEGTDNVTYKLFNESYNVGADTDADVAEGILPADITRDYIECGRLAYDLMQQSKYTDSNSGETHYYFAQEDCSAVLTDTIAPTLCKIKMGVMNSEVTLGDTIINMKDETPIQLPFSYAGHSFNDAMLVGWDNPNREGVPTATSGVTHDFSVLRTKPNLYYTLFVDASNAPEVLDVHEENEWKGAGVLAGEKKTNLMVSRLKLEGLNAWSLPKAPQVIEGNNNNIVAALPLVSEMADTAAAVTAVRSAKSLPDVTIKNICVETDILTEDVLSEGGRHLNLENVILRPFYVSDGDPVWFDFNTATQKENRDGVNLHNVIEQDVDSAYVYFYQNGTSLQYTTFSDENKNNDYKHILGYMLAQDDMFSTFGLRLDTVDAKVAGKLGFATDEGKRIYRAKVYNQATGEEAGEVLMNIDALTTFSIAGGNGIGEMHRGLPEGTFAVLSQTKKELGEDFTNLAPNVITKDGYATCLRIDERVTDGFAYPEGLAGDVNIEANRVEYVRQVRRDGSFEDIYLPFSFTTLEFDENEFADPAGQIEICFMQTQDGDIINKDGGIDLTSVGAYKQKKFEETLEPDPEAEDEVAVACVPYLVRFNGQDRKDELTTVTFSCNSACAVYRNAEQYDNAFFGVFRNSTVSQAAGGKTIYRLESTADEETGQTYSRFVKANVGDVVKAFHFYMSTNSPLAGNVVNISVDNKPVTGINDVKTSAVSGSDKIYDINGRRVTKMQPHNVYIKNGKKIIVL